MAWIYFRELAESQSLSENGCGQSPIVKTIDLHKPFYYRECGTENCQPLQYGTMLQLLKQNIFPNQPTSSMEDFPVRTSVLQEMEQAWKETEADCFLKSSDYLGNYDPASCSWKTSQLSLFEALSPFAQSSLRFGMIVAGRLYQPLRWEPHTLENDGSYLPTPTTVEGGRNKSASAGAAIRPSLGMMARKNLWPTPCARDWKDNGKSPAELARNSLALSAAVGGKLNPQFVEWLMGYNTDHTELNALGMQLFQAKQEKPL